MQIQIESPHIEPDENLKELIYRKFGHLVKRYDRIVNCDVVLRKETSDVQKHSFVEAKMEVPKTILFASANAETFEIALDKVIEELEHQLRRYKKEMEEKR